ncbi:ferrichrome ABC transporter substrate-binding protein [[Phormidium ambiguum] IAM M-71]|uniref:Ferrichrome ABC transporter substrate-binding protein n=1 Tax=[Phormidium ambiguum] IAM M-71 TaxID=454136 RepID=A0A1U7IKU7_9CYAN|nr:iron-siderophore ABC transporter substrate-binding protein [Phormidium ambiguum]OKH37861.1 ferrichrome ABC transporter substrate-binding protein [Phormidium ambiguum IAM M-71]
MNLSRRKLLITAAATAITVACSQQKPSVNQTAKTNDLRVVALEWTYVENLLALGIQPVGVADIAGYKKYVNIMPQLSQNVQDVGTRQEPSLEAIAQLQPNLILGLELRHQPILKTLSSIGKTLLFNPYVDPEKGNQFEEMQQTFRQIAQACDRVNQGEVVLKNLENSLTESSTKIKSANLAGNPFILGQFVPDLRLFTQNALAVQVLEKIGLKNAWGGKVDRFGFNTVGLESLLPVEKSHFLYIAENDRVPQQGFASNPVWKRLEFVKENRLYSLGEDTWVFGGPLSAQILVEKVVESLVRSS